jgi:predicted ATPase
MASLLTHIHVQNYRSLADVQLDLKPINVVFGPNGYGKTTLLDVLWFLHDCVDRDTGYALSSRNHGVGLLNDNAQSNQRLSVAFSTTDYTYQVSFGQVPGRISAQPQEQLTLVNETTPAFDRGYSDDPNTCRWPGELELKCSANELGFVKTAALASFWAPESPLTARVAGHSFDLKEFWHFASTYHTRSFSVGKLKLFGSETGPDFYLVPTGENLWSVLRNLRDQEHVSAGYDLIMSFMKDAFPTFDGLRFQQTGPISMYCSLVESNRASPVPAFAASDGYIQMLLLLAALFGGEPREDGLPHPYILLLDEPDLSLHPWAIAVFAKAVKKAVEDWGRQVFIVTHSPVLLSQFEPDQMLVAKSNEGRTEFERVSEIEEVQDLLEQYALGSLYMSEEVGPQSAAVTIGDRPE